MTEKKFFVLNSVSYTIVTGSRWYVEYYVQHPAGVKERKRAYGQINREKDLVRREEKAIALIKAIAGGIDYNVKSMLMRTLQENKIMYRTKTYQTYISRLKFYSAWLNGRSEESISPADANHFIRYALEKKSNGTVRGYRRTLSSLYNKWNAALNPFKGSIQPSRTYQSLMFFSDDQIKRLKQYFKKENPDMWFAIQLLFYCFIRPGEMRWLKVNDINTEYGFIEIRPSVSKTKKAQKVSIPEPFRKDLIKYLKGKEGLIFRTNKGKQVSLNYFNRNHKEGLKGLEITGRYAFYSWKHTGAVKAVKAGINLKDLQLQLRHHSLDMVNEYLKNLGVMDSEDLRKKYPSL